MNNQTQSLTDDQELAKALAGVNQGDDTSSTPPNSTIPVQSFSDGADDVASSTLPPVEPTQSFAMSPLTNVIDPSTTTISTDLAGIKDEALNELRPLIDKLNVEPEEKFNTILLLIRSTDDKSLISLAHEAAKQITDEAKKAQALLDVIKEIDYLSSAKQ